MKKLKNTAFFYPRVWHRDITNSRRACKDEEHKQDLQDKHEDIEKKLDIFLLLNGILAKTRNTIFQKRFPDRIVDS